MRKLSPAVAAVTASLALVGGAGVALAQSGTGQRGRMIEVPPGAFVIVLPGAAMPGAAVPGMSWSGRGVDAALPFPVMPGPSALLRQIEQQMDRMMADAQRSFASPAWDLPSWTDPERVIEAATRQISPSAGPVSGVVVTSFSDGHDVCTQRVVYPGNGAAPQVQVSSTGNGCKALRAPASAPSIRPYKPRIPHTLQVHYEVPTAPLVRPLQVAELGD